jgi:uncharacterized iron-regulated membrane protein
MMTTTSFTTRLANYRAEQAARSANVRYASYVVLRDGKQIAEVSFPSDTRNANFAGVCFYNPVTGEFLGDTQVEEFTLVRTA